MRRAITFGLLMLFSLTLVGCGGEKKPDPRERPGFVDTSDPTKLQMLPKDPRAPKDQPAEKQ